MLCPAHSTCLVSARLQQSDTTTRDTRVSKKLPHSDGELMRKNILFAMEIKQSTDLPAYK
jgi:hypothetical protein